MSENAERSINRMQDGKAPSAFGAPPKRTLLSIIDAMLENIEENGGAVTDELDALELELATKVDAYKAVCMQLESERKALRELIAAYTVRAGARENAIDALRERLRFAMERAGVSEMRGKTCKASFGVSTSVVVADEAAFLLTAEDRFVKTTHVIKKSVLKEALEAGEKVDGAELVTSKHLVLR